MRGGSIWLILGIAMILTSTSVTGIRGQQTPGSEPVAERGQAIAVGAGAGDSANACFRCHGDDGSGDAVAGFPRLAGQKFTYLLNSLRNYASGERESEIMEPIAQALSPQEMADVAAYYAQLEGDAAGQTEPPGDVEALQLGAAIAAVGHAERDVQACINCHGPDGEGYGVLYPYLAGQHTAYLEQQLKAFKDGSRGGDLDNIMGFIAERLTEAEIDALALYYGTMPPPDPVDRALVQPPALLGEEP